MSGDLIAYCHDWQGALDSESGGAASRILGKFRKSAGNSPRDWLVPATTGGRSLSVAGAGIRGWPAEWRIEFAAKLRLTAALFGCTTGKELCNRFRAINPVTGFDLERSRKWLQGRALPRQIQVYDDWAKLLGTARTGHWLARCTLDAFLDEVATLFDADPSDLLRRANQLASRSEQVAVTQHSSGHTLGGAYVAYSHAWSPYHRGQLIRGTLVITPSKGVGLVASYSEMFTGQPVRWAGPI